ncbi:CYFA0S05e04852g1_1 [Cyberlindnera fabianii]|uniref:Protein-lysine N-methyltransferase EFM5 n=1 Tax=Cyberlindnera fabianii TaxID=36022 RepID=A0A061AZJ4_CYBFA|nr:CYFA0S05e04852g1_1 [Cyberlindnera fabianii]
MEFKNEKQEREEQFAKLQEAAEKKFVDSKLIKEKGMDLFQEDWQLSQFWYSDNTADILADELLEGADDDTVICIASAPSVYAAIKKRDADTLPTQQIWLLEFDKRFSALAGDKFGFYDYNHPLELPEAIKGKVNRLLIDPPFLEEQCQTKSSQSAHALLSKDKTSKTKNGVLKYRLISCTGERMRDVIKKTYPDTNPTTFLPEHANGLSNEFMCYASYEGKNWKWNKN